MIGEEKRTILAIDDAPLDLNILKEILKDYRFLAVTGTEAAMNIICSGKPPDLVLLDILMPGIDGIEFCRKIKANDAARNIPIIFVTSKDAMEDEASGFAAGGVDYIVKPVNPHLLRARIKTHLELKLSRENLETQNEILRENAQLREEVEHINRHDLKNPLMVIMNIPQVLLRHPNITPEQRTWLKMLEDAGRKMLDMINRSIDVYKMEKGTYDLHPVRVDALKIIRQITAGQEKSAGDRKVEIGLTVRGKLSENGDSFHIDAEELLFYSMISNLIRNAIEASPVGGKVSIALSGEDTSVIGIHNSGAIPERIRGRFFEKFATAEKQGGTGLGAYSAKLIARTLGGTIGYETSEETGTTITVTLPLAK
jgi:signal transduction histidine kinase